MKAKETLLNKGEIPEILDLQEELSVELTGKVDQMTIQALDSLIVETEFDKSKYIEDCIEDEEIDDLPNFIREKAISAILKQRYEDDLEKIHKFMKDCYEDKVKSSVTRIIMKPYNPEYEGSKDYEDIRKQGGRIIRLSGGGDVAKQDVITNQPKEVRITAREILALSPDDARAFNKLTKSKAFKESVKRNDTYVINEQGNFKVETGGGGTTQTGMNTNQGELRLSGIGKGYNKTSKGLGALMDEIRNFDDKKKSEIKKTEEPKKEDCPDKKTVYEGRLYTVNCKGVNKNVELYEGKCYDVSGAPVNCITGLTESDSTTETKTEEKKQTPKSGGTGKGQPCPKDLTDVVSFQKWMSKNYPKSLGSYGQNKDGVDGKCGPLTNLAWKKYGAQYQLSLKAKPYVPLKPNGAFDFRDGFTSVADGNAGMLKTDKGTVKNVKAKDKTTLMDTYKNMSYGDRAAIFSKLGNITVPILGGLAGYVAADESGTIKNAAGTVSMLGLPGRVTSGIINGINMTGRSMIYGDEYIDGELSMDAMSAVGDLVGGWAGQKLLGKVMKKLGIDAPELFNKAKVLISKSPALQKRFEAVVKSGNVEKIKEFVTGLTNKAKILKTDVLTKNSSTVKKLPGNNLPTFDALKKKGFNSLKEAQEAYLKSKKLKPTYKNIKDIPKGDFSNFLGMFKEGGNLFTRLAHGGSMKKGKYIKAQNGIGKIDLSLKPQLLKRFNPLTGKFEEASTNVDFNTDLLNRDERNPNGSLKQNVLPTSLNDIEKPKDSDISIERMNQDALNRALFKANESLNNFKPLAINSPTDSIEYEDDQGFDQKTKRGKGISKQEGIEGNILNNGNPIDRERIAKISDLIKSKKGTDINLNLKRNPEYIEPALVTAEQRAKTPTDIFNKSSDPTLNAALALSATTNTQATNQALSADNATKIQSWLGAAEKDRFRNNVQKTEFDNSLEEANYKNKLAKEQRKLTADRAIQDQVLRASLGQKTAEHQTNLMTEAQKAKEINEMTLNENRQNELTKLQYDIQNDSNYKNLQNKELSGTLTDTEKEELLTLQKQYSDRHSQIIDDNEIDVAKQTEFMKKQYDMAGLGNFFNKLITPNNKGRSVKRGGSLTLVEQKALAKNKTKLKEEIAERKRLGKLYDSQMKEINKYKYAKYKIDVKKDLEYMRNINKILSKLIK